MKFGFRWFICGLLFLMVAVNYLHRLTVSILKGPLSTELGWSEADYGAVAAGFSFAYAFGYLLGGRVLDHWGVKGALPVFVGGWSLAAMAHGACAWLPVGEVASWSWPGWVNGGLAWTTITMPLAAVGFVAARIGLGLLQGGAFPSAVRTVAEWFPPAERALATGLFNAGTNTGAIVCPLLVPLLYLQFGWQATFYLTGAAGFLWLGL